MTHMAGGQGELDSGLHEVVANGNLPAISIAPASRAELLQVVRVSLDKDRHIKACNFQSVGYTLLVAKVRENDKHAIDLLRVSFEQFGALARVGVSFDPAEFALLFGQLDRTDPTPLADVGNIAPRLRDQLIGKEVAVAVDDAEARGCRVVLVAAHAY
jgi:hypothetical protein